MIDLTELLESDFSSSTKGDPACVYATSDPLFISKPKSKLNDFVEGELAKYKVQIEARFRVSELNYGYVFLRTLKSFESPPNSSSSHSNKLTRSFDNREDLGIVSNTAGT